MGTKQSSPQTDSEANNILSEQDLTNTIGELMKSLEETSRHLESIGEQFQALQTFHDQ